VQVCVPTVPKHGSTHLVHEYISVCHPQSSGLPSTVTCYNGRAIQSQGASLRVLRCLASTLPTVCLQQELPNFQTLAKEEVVRNVRGNTKVQGHILFRKLHTTTASQINSDMHHVKGVLARRTSQPITSSYLLCAWLASCMQVCIKKLWELELDNK